MKTILLPVEEHSLLHPMLQTALLLGRSFESYIEGVPVSLNLPVALPIDIAIGVSSVLDPATRREMAEAARQHFESFMAASSVRRTGPEDAPGLGFGWHTGELMSDTDLGSYGRVFDITVVGRPSGSANHPRLATAEAALFESGRPILIAPPVAPETIGRTALIAWNASTETARTVSHAMPFLKRADRVVVLTLENWGGAGPSGEDLARSLRHHGIPVEVMRGPNPGGKPGEAILSAAASLGCDLLVKGAYTQSRLRQMILGGATSHILANTTMPVIMAH
jgi:nucleotide-binding universal stress UspA family protein